MDRPKFGPVSLVDKGFAELWEVWIDLASQICQGLRRYLRLGLSLGENEGFGLLRLLCSQVLS